MEEEGSPNATKGSLYSFASPPKGKSLIHYGTPEGGHQTRQVLGNLQNLTKGSQVIHKDIKLKKISTT
jgi:hypothetical protein